MSDYKIKKRKRQLNFDLIEKYEFKKMKNEELIKYISKHLSQSNLENVWNCGTYLNFLATEDEKFKKLNKSNFCKNRFCPMCSWIATKKDALKIAIMLNYIMDNNEYEFIFVTLTAPNVSGDRLNDEIKKYNNSFKKLMEKKEVSNISKGYIRKLEVTYNKKRNDYHPHFHVIIAVNKSYFKSRDYLSKNKWLQLWQHCMKDDTITQVDVRKMKTNDSKGVVEIAKYGAKDSDYMVSQEVFDIFYKALKGKQILTYSGIFKNTMLKYKAGELDHYKETDLNIYVKELIYLWGTMKKYLLHEQRELSEEEILKVNRKLMQELDID